MLFYYTCGFLLTKLPLMHSFTRLYSLHHFLRATSLSSMQGYISPTLSSLTINNWAISHFHNSISLSTSQRYLPFTFTRLSISPPSSQGYLSFLLTLPSLTRHNLLPLKDYEIIFQFPTLASPFLLYTQSTVYIPSSCRPALTSSKYD